MTDVMLPNSAMQGALAFAAELAKAELLPKPYQRKPAMILMAMEIARDLGCSVVAVMNGTYEIGGRLAYYTDFMLAQARRAGVIKSVSYETAGEGSTLAVTARAVLGTGEVVEATVGMPEAQAEGWTRNSKYRTSPEQMLRKRAIKRLIGNHCPEVMLGASADGDEAAEASEDTGSVQRAPNAISRVLSRLGPPANEPPPAEMLPAEPLPNEPAHLVELERPQATPERIEAVRSEVAAGAQVPTEAVSVQGEAAPLDLTDKGHRALVGEACRARGIPQRWITLHKTNLEAYLKTRDVRATPESIGEAVEAYVIANPPKQGTGA